MRRGTSSATAARPTTTIFDVGRPNHTCMIDVADCADVYERVYSIGEGEESTSIKRRRSSSTTINNSSSRSSSCSSSASV